MSQTLPTALGSLPSEIAAAIHQLWRDPIYHEDLGRALKQVLPDGFAGLVRPPSLLPRPVLSLISPVSSRSHGSAHPATERDGRATCPAEEKWHCRDQLPDERAICASHLCFRQTRSHRDIEREAHFHGQDTCSTSAATGVSGKSGFTALRA